MSTATASTTTAIVFTREQLAHSFQAAVAERIIAYRNDDGTYACPSSDGTTEYTVSWFDGSPLAAAMCTCKAGQNGRCCKHVCAAIFARKHGVSAKRPAAIADEYTGPLGFVTSQTPGLSPTLAASLARMDAANARAALIFAGRA